MCLRFRYGLRCIFRRELLLVSLTRYNCAYFRGEDGIAISNLDPERVRELDYAMVPLRPVFLRDDVPVHR